MAITASSVIGLNLVGAELEKHVLFGLAGETYAISLLQLKEVIAQYEITVLPNLPDNFHGVIGIRGEVIPVINLRKRFGFDEHHRDAASRVMIVDLEPNPIGIQVDRVFRVETIDKVNMRRPPELTCGQKTPFVNGVSERPDGKLVIHLDMQRILSSLERIELAQLSDSIRASFMAQRQEYREAGSSIRTEQELSKASSAPIVNQINSAETLKPVTTKKASAVEESPVEKSVSVHENKAVETVEEKNKRNGETDKDRSKAGNSPTQKSVNQTKKKGPKK